MGETTPESGAATSEMQTTHSWSFGWLGASSLATLALSLAAAHTPPRVRLIGLFSVVFGLIVGWLVVQLSRVLDVRPTAVVRGGMAAMLTFAGLAGTTCEIMRLEVKGRPNSSKEMLAQRLLEEMKTGDQLESPRQTDPSVLADFRRHLSTRLRKLGEWPKPWPEIFWLGELTLASVISAWIARHVDREGSQSAR